MRDTERRREAVTQAEREAGSMQGAQCGTPSRVSRITPQAEGGAKPLGHRGCPSLVFFKDFVYFFREYKWREGQKERERESQADSTLSAESNMWLDHITPRPCPEPKITDT